MKFCQNYTETILKFVYYHISYNYSMESLSISICDLSLALNEVYYQKVDKFDVLSVLVLRSQEISL